MQMLSLMLSLYITAVQNLLQQKTVQRSTNTVHQTMPPVCQAAPPVCQTVPVCAWVLTVWPFPSCRALTLLSLRYSLRLFTKLLGNKGMMKLTCSVQARLPLMLPISLMPKLLELPAQESLMIRIQMRFLHTYFFFRHRLAVNWQK